jgi:hypothetical protein
MSMKRSHPKSSGSRRRDGEDSPFAWAQKGAQAPEKSWQEWVDGKPDEAFAPYSLKSRFAEGALMAHPKFGKGAVVSVQGGTIEVLFSEGKKRLGHGQ